MFLTNRKGHLYSSNLLDEPLSSANLMLLKKRNNLFLLLLNKPTFNFKFAFLYTTLTLLMHWLKYSNSDTETKKNTFWKYTSCITYKYSFMCQYVTDTGSVQLLHSYCHLMWTLFVSHFFYITPFYRYYVVKIRLECFMSLVTGRVLCFLLRFG